MAEVETAIKDKIAQLNLARSLVLQDPTHYPDILKGILPIIVASSSVIELRRWGAEFLAETFSSPLINAQKKQELALVCLDPLATLLGEAETGILKNVIQCSSSIYPLVFRYMYVITVQGANVVLGDVLARRSYVVCCWTSSCWSGYRCDDRLHAVSRAS